MYGAIYKLFFTGTNKVYIGQAKDPKIRLAKHLLSLRSGTASIKLLEAYKAYGEPDMEILCYAESMSELNSLEKEAIEIYDSVSNGFNTQGYVNSAWTGVVGERNGNSKYSNSDIIEIVKYILQNPKTPIRQVAKTLGVGVVFLEELVSGKRHKWLADTNPKEHSELMALKGTRSKAYTAKDMGIIYPTIYSPNGVPYNVTGVRSFAREHGLNNTCLCSVLNGKQKQHKGWSLAPYFTQK